MAELAGYLCATLLIGGLGIWLTRSGLPLVRQESNRKVRGWISLVLGGLFTLAALLNIVRFFIGG